MEIEEVKILGKIRGIQEPEYLLPPDDTNAVVQLSGQGEQESAFGESIYTEITRQGRSFRINTAVAVATVIAMPTTATAFALYNNEPDGGRHYIIDQVFAIYVASTTTIAQVGIVGCLGQVREAIPTNAMSATVTLKKQNGMQNYDTRARVILTATALPATTGFAGNWMPLGKSVHAVVTSLPGFQQVIDLDGRFIVPPGRYFALHAVSNVVNVTAQFGLTWTEKPIFVG